MKFLTTKIDDIKGIRHGFFTRQGGVSTGVYAGLNTGFGSNDAAENVETNRQIIADALGLESVQNLLTCYQTHSATAVTVTTPWPRGKAPEADAMVTDRPGIALGILTADCAPVLFADRKKKIVGAAHAGWRGAAGGVLAATVEAMRALGSDTADIVAAIGPCIGLASYEVSDSFRADFMVKDPANSRFFSTGKRAGHCFFDLPAFVAAELNRAGIETVYDTRQDTLPNEAVYYSYRRSCLAGEKDYGRQMSVIMIAGGANKKRG